MNICIIGDARMGKDTVAAFIEELSDLKCTASSELALEIFLYDKLKDKYGYNTIQEAYNDRVNHRKEWQAEIRKFNEGDLSRLARLIMEKGNVYVGMRDVDELQACTEANVFDLILGVIDPRKPRETHSKIVDAEKDADYIIYNNSSLENLKKEVELFLKTFKIIP